MKSNKQDNSLLEKVITLKRLELYLLDLPQKSAFVSGIGKRKSKETLIVKWIDLEGNVAYGECSCRPDPYYSAEFLMASVSLIEKFIVPFLQPTQTYGDVLQLLKKIRGWNFTKSAIESAMFQLVKTQQQYDLSNAINEKPISEVPVGISLGIYGDAQALYEKVQESIDESYKRLKFKISPAVDTKVFDYINPLLFDHQVQVNFDANGSFREGDLDKLGYFVNTYQTAIEQPTPPNRFDLCLLAKQKFPDLKVCFDEEVKSIGDLVKLHALEAIDELNLKIGRVGGITNSIQILNYCSDHDIPCWIGGMFETGIGRLQNLEFAAHLPNAKAHDLSPSSRYFKEDIISPEVQMKNGTINVAAAKKSKVVQETIDKYTTQKIIKKYPL